MKRLLGIIAVVGILAFASLAAFGAKPMEVIGWSNGFPSGEHYNLNIHGKKDGYQCNETPGGNSVFVPEYGDAEIQLVQNRKSSVDGLYVHDPCSFSANNDPAIVQLESGEYQVYARILAKPKKDTEQRSVVFYPKLVDACNENASSNATFGDFINCTDDSLIGLGIVTKDGAFTQDMQSFERRKGKSKAVEITDMFRWSGYACNETYDIDGDGEITINDTTDLNGDNVTDETDLALYLDMNCVEFSNAWIYDIADLVIYGWDYKNTGAKLVQVRFYPIATTEFS